jgi:hypothetical protein
MMLTWKQLLEYFQSKSTPENIGSLMDNPELRAAIRAWPSVRVEINTSDDMPIVDSEDSENDKWERLWEYVKPDLTAFQTSSGARAIDTESLFMRLKSLRLIFPNGTIDKTAKIYLGLLIQAEIARLKKEASNNE